MKYGTRLRYKIDSDKETSSEDEWDAKFYRGQRLPGYVALMMPAPKGMRFKKKKAPACPPVNTDMTTVLATKIEVETDHASASVGPTIATTNNDDKLYGKKLFDEWVPDSEPDSIDALLDEAL